MSRGIPHTQKIQKKNTHTKTTEPYRQAMLYKGSNRKQGKAKSAIPKGPQVEQAAGAAAAVESVGIMKHDRTRKWSRLKFMT